MDQMYEDLATHGASAGNLLAPLTRIRHAVDAAQASATRISRFNEGVFVFSMVVYAGEDQAARQASSIVVGDSFGWEIMQENIVDVRKALNGLVDTVRYVSFV
jgi:hypothetical protein